ncbi:hypothetical protein JCM10369A_43090 [Nocardioides pyridinolyticus]
MTTLLRADPRAASVEPATAIVRPDTLTDQDADRIAAAIDAARTESTRRVYAYTWGQWARWCAARELSPLPGDPAAVHRRHPPSPPGHRPNHPGRDP